MNRATPAPFLLVELKPGESATICTLAGGQGFTSRLTSLGFTPGVEVEMIMNPSHGPLIVSVRDTRVALGRQEAGKITVVGRDE